MCGLKAWQCGSGAGEIGTGHGAITTAYRPPCSPQGSAVLGSLELSEPAVVVGACRHPVWAPGPRGENEHREG